MGTFSDAFNKSKEEKKLQKPKEEIKKRNLPQQESGKEIKKIVSPKSTKSINGSKQKIESTNSDRQKKSNILKKQEVQIRTKRLKENTTSKKIHLLKDNKIPITGKENIGQDLRDNQTIDDVGNLPVQDQEQRNIRSNQLKGQQTGNYRKNLAGPTINSNEFSEKLMNAALQKLGNQKSERNKKDLAESVVDREEIAEKLLMLRKEYSKQSFKKKPIKKKFFRKKRKEDLFTFFSPSSIISEQYKITRTILLTSIKAKKMKTILVTSCLPAEGKSFVASNLAVSIARGFDQYVLLVDADLRKPAQQEIFKIDSKLGLADFLIDEKYQLMDLIQKTKVSKLSVLPAGSGLEISSELLSSDLMRLFIQDVKYRYDDRYIIIDSPPTLMSESLALADKVDYVILVVRAGKTDKKLVKQTAEIIGMHKIIGVILNHCTIKQKAYYGYYQK